MPLVVSIQFDAGHGTLERPNHSSRQLFCHAICSSESVHIKQLTSIIMVIIIVDLKILCTCNGCGMWEMHRDWLCGQGDSDNLKKSLHSTARKKLFKVELQSDAMMDEGERTDVHLDGSCEGSKRSFLGTRRRVWLRKLQQSSLIFPSHESDESEARVHLNLLSSETKRVTMTSRRVRESFMGEFFKVSLRISCWLCVYESEWFLKSRDLSWRRK